MTRQSANLPTLSHLEFHKKVIEGFTGNMQNKRSQERGRPSSKDVEDSLNGKLYLLLAHEGKTTKDFAVFSNRKVKRGRKETLLYCDICPRKPGLHPN
jgi:hypothetical protein